LIRDGLFGMGGIVRPVWPKHWALPADSPGIQFDPAGAADVLRRAPGGVRFTCLVVSEYERIALALKRQLQSVGVTMTVEAAPIKELQDRVAAGRFDAMLIDAVSGPSILRPYLWWHSNAPKNFGRFAADVDRALDAVRHADSGNDYQAGVVRFQQAILNDPPAIFLAWIERARAVSHRFIVEGAEPGVDMVGTMRQWRPAGREAPSPRP
jgi:ABC-type transport system substrate-binding protein